MAWIEGCKSVDEIRREAQDVERQYVASGSDKVNVLHFVRKISSWIMLYGQVLDVLSQHHPEYLALAWGSVKFILMVRTPLAMSDPHFSDSER